MELKTLNDLRKGNLKVPYILMESKIKSEAIKWIKHFKERRKITTRSGVKKDTGSIQSFKHFFNITEEDLK